MKEYIIKIIVVYTGECGTLSNISDRAFCENSKRLSAVDYFRTLIKTPSYMFYRVLNMPLQIISKVEPEGQKNFKYGGIPIA